MSDTTPTNAADRAEEVRRHDEPLTQAVADRIAPAVVRYVSAHPYMNITLAMGEPSLEREDPLNVAVVVAKLTEAGMLRMKYKWDDDERLYDDLSEMVDDERRGRQGGCGAVWIKRASPGDAPA